MSTIDDIVRIEAEAASLVAEAQKQADALRQAGLDAAAKIADDARVALAADDAALGAATAKRIKDEDDQLHRETADRIAAWQARFDTKAAAVANRVVTALLTKGA